MDYNVLDLSSFTIGQITIKGPAGNGSTVSQFYKAKIGMRAVAVRNETDPSSVSWFTIPFEDFCDVGSNANIGEDSVVTTGDCDACHAVSNRIVTTLFISVIMCFPSITTSVLRLYPGYDCNCQKVFASFAASISVAFAFYTLCSYQFRCFKSFGYGESCFEIVDGIASPIPPTGCYYGWRVTRFYFMGPGWIALCVASCFKVLDMLLNMVIPTPTICRDQDEQREYEVLVKGEVESRDEENDSGKEE